MFNSAGSSRPMLVAYTVIGQKRSHYVTAISRASVKGLSVEMCRARLDIYPHQQMRLQFRPSKNKSGTLICRSLVGRIVDYNMMWQWRSLQMRARVFDLRYEHS